MESPPKISSAPASVEATAAGDGVLAVSGVLTFDTVPGLYAQSTAWVQSADRAAAIDLKNLQRADSAGLALLVEWLRLARANGRELKLLNVPEQVKSLIRVSGLSKALQVDPP